MDNQGYTARELPGNPNHAIGDIIAAAKTLEDIYNAEIDALSKTDTQAFMELQNSKIEAAQNYYSFVTQMIERKGELKHVDASMKKKLHEMYASFNETTEQNLQVMRRMQRCSARIGETLRNAAVKSAKRRNSLSYSASGDMSEVSPNKIISSGLCETV